MHVTRAKNIIIYPHKKEKSPFLGYDEYIRGNSNVHREGHNMMLYSIECSYPILNEFDFSIKLPLLPQSLTSARIGIFINAFADVGNAFDNIHNLKLSDSYYGYGLGLTFLILPYNSLRFEYAFNENGKGEFIIGTGFSF